MDNKTEYFTLKEDGVIGWIENMPEEPVIVEIVGNEGRSRLARQLRKEYNEALQSAIANATEVSNLKVWELETRLNQLMEVGKVYPLLCQVAVLPWSTLRIYSSGDAHKSMPLKGNGAFVTFSEPSAGVEETQEELWDDAITITGVYYPSTFGRFKVIEELSKAFTITRKNK